MKKFLFVVLLFFILTIDSYAQSIKILHNKSRSNLEELFQESFNGIVLNDNLDLLQKEVDSLYAYNHTPAYLGGYHLRKYFQDSIEVFHEFLLDSISNDQYISFYIDFNDYNLVVEEVRIQNFDLTLLETIDIENDIEEAIQVLIQNSPNQLSIVEILVYGMSYYRQLFLNNEEGDELFADDCGDVFELKDRYRYNPEDLCSIADPAYNYSGEYYLGVNGMPIYIPKNSTVTFFENHPDLTRTVRSFTIGIGNEVKLFRARKYINLPNVFSGYKFIKLGALNQEVETEWYPCLNYENDPLSLKIPTSFSECVGFPGRKTIKFESYSYIYYQQYDQASCDTPLENYDSYFSKASMVRESEEVEIQGFDLVPGVGPGYYDRLAFEPVIKHEFEAIQIVQDFACLEGELGYRIRDRIFGEGVPTVYYVDGERVVAYKLGSTAMFSTINIDHTSERDLYIYKVLDEKYGIWENYEYEYDQFTNGLIDVVWDIFVTLPFETGKVAITFVPFAGIVEGAYYVYTGNEVMGFIIMGSETLGPISDTYRALRKGAKLAESIKDGSKVDFIDDALAQADGVAKKSDDLTNRNLILRVDDGEDILLFKQVDRYKIELEWSEEVAQSLIDDIGKNSDFRLWYQRNYDNLDAVKAWDRVRTAIGNTTNGGFTKFATDIPTLESVSKLIADGSAFRNKVGSNWQQVLDDIIKKAKDGPCSSCGGSGLVGRSEMGAYLDDVDHFIKNFEISPGSKGETFYNWMRGTTNPNSGQLDELHQTLNDLAKRGIKEADVVGIGKQFPNGTKKYDLRRIGDKYTEYKNKDFVTYPLTANGSDVDQMINGYIKNINKLDDLEWKAGLAKLKNKGWTDSNALSNMKNQWQSVFSNTTVKNNLFDAMWGNPTLKQNTFGSLSETQARAVLDNWITTTDDALFKFIKAE